MPVRKKCAHILVFSAFFSVCSFGQTELISGARAQSVVTTRFGDWDYNCLPQGRETPPRCELVQVATSHRGKHDDPVLSLALSRAREEHRHNLTLTLLVPLNVDLEAGLSLWVDGMEPLKLHYRNCNETGCWARQDITADFLQKLSATTRGYTRFRLVQGEDVTLSFSLRGFKQGLAQIHAGPIHRIGTRD